MGGPRLGLSLLRTAGTALVLPWQPPVTFPIKNFYGSFYLSCNPYCGEYYYVSNGGQLAFYSAVNGSIISSIDMGGLSDETSGYSSGALFLYSNNGVSILKKSMLTFTDGCYPPCYRQSFQPQNVLQPSISIPFLLPLSLTLENGKIYGEVGYNNTFENYNSTTQTFSDDLFAIRSNAQTSIQWIRIKTPPPNDILPIANTIK